MFWDDEIAEEKKYNIYHVIAAGFNLEPIHCLFCGSTEVTYLQYVGDALCENCGKWQIEDSEDMDSQLFWESDNGKYAIYFTDSGIRVDNNDMLTCDWPIRYSHSGRIAYNHPEWFPGYVKSQIYKAFDKRYGKVELCQ